MRAFLEARCPNEHSFNYLVGAPAKCPTCGWPFKVAPQTSKNSGGEIYKWSVLDEVDTLLRARLSALGKGNEDERCNFQGS